MPGGPGSSYAPEVSTSEPLPPVLLLDLDDTILTFTAGGRDFWAEAFAALGHEVSDVGAEDFRAAIRASSSAFWGDHDTAAAGRQDLYAARRLVAGGAFERLGREPDATSERLADHYTRTKEEAVAPFPRAIETLVAFREQGLRLGLITNGSSEFQRAKIERYDLAGYFDAIFIEGEFGVGKPDARVFHAALEALDAKADEAWMVGDNLHADIAGAQAVGIQGVWHDWRRGGLGEDAPTIPRRVIHGLDELLPA